MSKFQAVQTPLSGPLILEPRVFEDARGYFMETWNEQDFTQLGLPLHFVQDNQSRSQRGVLRGLHFQREYPQGKLVRVLSGEIFDVVVDLRQSSPQLGQWFGVRLSAENRRMFYVPEGFAHGFLVLSEWAEVFYKCTEFYRPGDEGGLLWSDPRVDIAWPLEEVEPILSEKDRNHPDLHALAFRYA